MQWALKYLTQPLKYTSCCFQKKHLLGLSQHNKTESSNCVWRDVHCRFSIQCWQNSVFNVLESTTCKLNERKQYIILHVLKQIFTFANIIHKIISKNRTCSVFHLLFSYQKNSLQFLVLEVNLHWHIYQDRLQVKAFWLWLIV